MKQSSLIYQLPLKDKAFNNKKMHLTIKNHVNGISHIINYTPQTTFYQLIQDYLNQQEKKIGVENVKLIFAGHEIGNGEQAYLNQKVCDSVRNQSTLFAIIKLHTEISIQKYQEIKGLYEAEKQKVKELICKLDQFKNQKYIQYLIKNQYLTKQNQSLKAMNKDLKYQNEIRNKQIEDQHKSNAKYFDQCIKSLADSLKNKENSIFVQNLIKMDRKIKDVQHQYIERIKFLNKKMQSLEKYIFNLNISEIVNERVDKMHEYVLKIRNQNKKMKEKYSAVKK